LESILEIAQTSWTGDSFIKRIDEVKTVECSMLLEDIKKVLNTSDKFIVIVHQDDSAESHAFLDDEEAIELANGGSRFFRFKMNGKTS
jgi:hypothetical protein